jgi:hypothetical protein
VSKKSAIYGTGPPTTKATVKSSSVGTGLHSSDILVLVPSLKRAHRVEYYKRFYPIWYIQLPAYEGRHRRRSRSKFIPQQSTILYFPRMQRMEAASCPLFDKQCGWLSEGYERHPPPYHVAMTRSSSRLTLLHGHRAPPLPCIKEMFVEVLSRIISMYPTTPRWRTTR